MLGLLAFHAKEAPPDTTLDTEELLRTLIEAEITARDASNARTRMKTAAHKGRGVDPCAPPHARTVSAPRRSACGAG
jgi:hypothetical protein